MKQRTMTHTGDLLGIDARTEPGYRKTVSLRETKNFWVSKHTTKYRKTDGYPAGNDDWPMYKLDLESVGPV